METSKTKNSKSNTRDVMKTIQCTHHPHHHNGFMAEFMHYIYICIYIYIYICIYIYIYIYINIYIYIYIYIYMYMYMYIFIYCNHPLLMVQCIWQIFLFQEYCYFRGVLTAIQFERTVSISGALHEKGSFPLRVSSVNVTKSAVCLMEKILNENIIFCAAGPTSSFCLQYCISLKKALAVIPTFKRNWLIRQTSCCHSFLESIKKTTMKKPTKIKLNNE